MNSDEPASVEVDPENIVEVGKYTVVATPTRNGVLHGEAWAIFAVVDPDAPILGDVDGDGVVTIIDATLIQRVLADFKEDPFNELAADVDGDGNMTVVDATYIQRYLAGLDCPKAIGQRLLF